MVVPIPKRRRFPKSAPWRSNAGCPDRSSGTRREPPGKLRLGPGGECGRLLVAHGHPREFPDSPYGIGDRIEAVPNDPVNALDPCLGQPVHELFRHRSMCHWSLLLSCPTPGTASRRQASCYFGCPAPDSALRRLVRTALSAFGACLIAPQGAGVNPAPWAVALPCASHRPSAEAGPRRRKKQE